MKLLALLLLAPALAAAQAYRCADGTYQQQPCPGGTKLEVPEPPAPGSREARVASAVARKTVFIGMTEAEVVRAWGRPQKINRSITARSTTEQWIYSGRQYLYLDNGVLRSIQTPE